MNNSDDIILFVKEVLSQCPSRSMVKIYAVGSALTVLGMVGGVVERVLLPFSADRSHEGARHPEADFCVTEKRGQELALKSHHTSIDPEAEDVLGTVLCDAKSRQRAPIARRSSATRLHAS